MIERERTSWVDARFRREKCQRLLGCLDKEPIVDLIFGVSYFSRSDRLLAIVAMIYETPSFLSAGDRFLLVEFGNELSLDLNVKCLALAKVINELALEGIEETVP